MKYIPYIIIGVLLTLLVFHKKSVPLGPTEIVKVDTLYDTLYIHDTVQGSPQLVYQKGDTVWMDSIQYIPDTNYNKLYQQYLTLGNAMFTRNTFVSKFKIDTFGEVSVIDTVYANRLISTMLVNNLKIPEKTVIVEKLRPQQKELYFGGGISYPFGAHTGIMYKDLKDRLIGASVGANAKGLTYNLSYYVKIK